MKKYILFVALPLLIVSCSKDSDPGKSYTDKQQQALALFHGKWNDVQFSNISWKHLAYLLPDPDIIVFTRQNAKSIEIDKNGWYFDNHGECIYYKMPFAGAEYEALECYYEVSADATQFRLLDKEANTIYGQYDLTITNDTSFKIHDNDLSLPYVFTKAGEEEQPQEVYSPIGVFLTKSTWASGEMMDMAIYPPNKGTLPQHYGYIDNVEYLVDGESIGKSTVSPFSMQYTPSLSPGQHTLSLKLNLNNANVIWATKTTSFNITE
ncbi:MAG: hypothetical protein LBR65_01310 [Culturomica sp.]|jgi:hypothetical protein|nr:hypothetical protein [Culturomica sp.]